MIVTGVDRSQVAYSVSEFLAEMTGNRRDDVNANHAATWSEKCFLDALLQDW